MSHFEAERSDGAEPSSMYPGMTRFLWQQLPYIVALVLTIAGVEERWRLIWTQAPHWVAVLVAMNIMLVSGVQHLLPTPVTSLVLLTLLGLGTFLAGVSLLSTQIAFLSVAMDITVPAISGCSNP